MTENRKDGKEGKCTEKRKKEKKKPSVKQERERYCDKKQASKQEDKM